MNASTAYFTVSADGFGKRRAAANRALPKLSGLELTDAASAELNDQTIYLDFDGENNVSYCGPVTINNLNVPAFNVAQAVKADIVRQSNKTFAGSGVTFTITPPKTAAGVSTIYVGGSGAAFSGHGDFLGLAETVDYGNKIKNDNAFVFADKLPLSRLAEVIAHETGHLLGYAHADAAGSQGPLGQYALTGNVKQLITFTTWNQDAPYNNLCPIDPTTNSRSAVGCVATAVSQLLCYWKATPSISFSDSDKYVSKTGKNNRIVVDIDKDAARLDFPTLSTLKTYLSSIKYAFSDAEKAALSFGVGIKCKMLYSSASSSALVSSCVSAFKSAFGFISAGLLTADKPATMVSSEFLSVVIDNLKKGGPVLTGVSQNDKDDAVIIDGFRESDQTFHVNLGWGGDTDGWYSLPSIPGFNQIDEFLIDVFPTGKANETYTVTNTNNYGVGSLRRAIEMANNKTGLDTIVFDPSLSGKTIALTTGAIYITEGLNLVGLGRQAITISGGWAGGNAKDGSNIFYVGNEAGSSFNVSISGLTLANGNSAEQAGALYNAANLTLQDVDIVNCKAKDYGGAIYNNGDLTAGRLKLANNQAVYGGGIANAGNLTIANSQLTGNSATRNGGGIFNYDGGDFTGVNCTISNNYAQIGGGISNSATITLDNTIVAMNRGRGRQYNDIFGTVQTKSSNNLVGNSGHSRLVNSVNGNKVGNAARPLNPGFVSAPDAGGDGKWNTGDDNAGDYRLLATSAAINAGNDSQNKAETDLDGNVRTLSTVDIGAYEFQGGDNVAPNRPDGLTAAVAGMSVALDWHDATDNFGTVRQYEVQVDRQSDFKSQDYSEVFTASNGTLADLRGGRYFWRARTEDAAGNFSDWSPTASFMIVPPDQAGNTLKTAKNIADGATTGSDSATRRIFIN